MNVLPTEGEVLKLEAEAQQKVDAVRQLLSATRREWYLIKVVDVPQAAVGLHARAVLLISAPAIALVNAAELQALAAHEIGHEYVWSEWHHARQQRARAGLKELELVCDAIAVVTLHRLGLDPGPLIAALEKISQFNRERFGASAAEMDYPMVRERRALVRQTQRWLRDANRKKRLRRGEVAGGLASR